MSNIKNIFVSIVKEYDNINSTHRTAPYAHADYPSIQVRFIFFFSDYIIHSEDFAENWRSIYQNEIQAAHFTYDQATLLTKIGTYRCPNVSREQIVNESIVFVS